MKQMELTSLLLNQSEEAIWVVDFDFKLIYANSKYLNLSIEVNGVEKKINTFIFDEVSDANYVEKWKKYYRDALGGLRFECKEHYLNHKTGATEVNAITFEPLTDEDNKIFAVSCKSKNITDRIAKDAETSQMIDASLDVFCTINEQGQFVYVSAASKNHWGYLPEELIGKSYIDLVLEQDVPKTIETAGTILIGKDIKSFVNRYHKKEGGIAYNLWSVRWDPITKLMYCLSRDCADKIEQDQIIQNSELRFKALIHEGSDLIAILDVNGTYLYVSPTSTSILGIEPEEFIGRSPFDFIHPDDASLVASSLAQIANQSRLIVKPFRFQNHKKKWRWIETILTNMLDNPAIKGFVANSRDITEQVVEKHKLKLLESVITNTKDSILITEAEPFDEPGPRILYVNEAFTKMTGYTSEEVIGKTPRILQGPKSDKYELARLSNAIRNWESCEINTINYKKNGEEFWINFSVTPVANEKGWYTHWIAIERDITDQKIKELENELIAQISINFYAENDYFLAVKGLCESIAKFGNFDLVEVWISNLEKSNIHLFNHYVALPSDELFYSNSLNFRALKMSESLAGKVWSQKVQLLWDEGDDSINFLRKEAAQKIGLKSMLGIPLIFNDEVVGVLKIGSKSNSTYLKQYTRIFHKLEEFIGSELNRKNLENDVSHLYNAIPGIICLLDFKGKFLKINSAGCDLLGYTASEITYQYYHEFVHPDDLNVFNMELEHFREEIEITETHFKFENRFISKSGQIIWLSWYCDCNIEENLIYATAKDITEEKKLRELNQQVSVMAKIGSWEVNLLNQTLFWSDEVHVLHETDPKLYVPELKTAIEFYRKDFRSMVELAIEQCITTGEPFDFEAILVTANNNEIWVRSIGNTEFVNGVCTRIYGGFQDINDRKLSEVRLQSLADNLPGIVYQYVIHPDGTDSLLYVSEGAQQLWGFTARQVMDNVNLVWDQIKAGGQFDQAKASIIKSVETKSKWNTRIKYLKPTGELRTHLGYGKPTFLADGTILFNSILLDITQEVKNEEMLLQATEMAHIGSWEMDLVNAEVDEMIWSPMTRTILEVDDEYNATLSGGLEFYTNECREKVTKALKILVDQGTEFDLELLLITAKGNDKWIRAIGKSERVNDTCLKIYGSFQDIHEQKISEIKLAESENRFRTILEVEPECIKLLNSNGELIMMNPAGLSIIEADNEEQIKGKSVIGLLLPEYKSAFLKVIKNVFKGESCMLEFQIMGLRGTYRWLDMHAVPMRNESGEITSLLGVTRDVTQRKKVEDEKTSLQKTIENSLNEIYIFDAVSLQFLYVNKGALINLGYTEKEVNKLTPLDIKPDFTLMSFRTIIDPLLNNDKGKVIFFTNHKRKDGSIYPVEVHLQLIIEGNNKRFLAIILDITERKKAEDHILNANERFEKVTEATNDVIWDWDMINESFYRSKAIEKFFGPNTSVALLEKDFWKDRFHPEDLEQIKHSIAEAIDNPLTNRWEAEYRIFTEDDKILYVFDRGLIVRNKEGKATRMVGAMTDISEQKQMTIKLNELNKSLQQHTLELERSNEELEQFAFIASHDLQEPLRMISSFMDLLDRKYGELLDDKALQYIHFATDGAKRMKQIILDLLDYSRASKVTEGREDVDVNELISDYKQLRRKLISEKSATIIAEQLPVLQTYKAAITQIIHCLLDNSLKYCKPNISPLIEIKTCENVKDWEFSIRDNGIGIDPQFYEKIFLIFQRLHNKDQYTGTGIGLSIAKRHIEYLGGRIWLDSSPGSYTVFYFTIPKIN